MPKSASVTAITPAVGPGSDDPFEYAIGDKTITLPSLSKLELTFKQRRTMAHSDAATNLVLLLEWVADPEVLKILDPLTDTEIVAIMTAWQEHSGISAGE